MKNAALFLLPPAVDRDTVECLETLLRHACKGEVIGIACAAALSRRTYITDTAGECHRNPTWARGMVRALDDALAEMVRR